ncbi:type I-F CRISPR-associated endoribonuclease Cas6/Csy4 [uncultured Mailhella sp.]|uniref:type I-F CRISPR-associated endoribonuclease Cas6/Csy4 n=1 Tax=uncultured Mailhella sp. TaxID=1981031 RepID=UPI0025E4130B|nr:type I-F CRISPR-associated endoribonuclease Cas6/Csy4 [uncultured Mailhella sp.]
MKPLWYCTMAPLAEGEDSGMSAAFMRGRMLACLHGIFAGKNGAFAVAVPEPGSPAERGGLLRVFASTCEDLEWLRQKLAASPWFRDYAHCSLPCAVAEDFSGTWFSYSRFRIPTLSTDRHEGEEHGRLRARRMKQAKEEALVYFILRSGSNGSRFSLHVRRMQGEAPEGECEPNGYGLCGAQRCFCLPELPWQ